MIPAGKPFAPEQVSLSRGDGSFTLTWLAPPKRTDADETEGDNGDPIVNYAVVATAAGTSNQQTFWVCAEGDTECAEEPPTTLTIGSGLQLGTTYEISVQAKNGVDIGLKSDTVSAMFAARPAQVSKPTVSSLDGKARVTWVKPAINGSEIIRYHVTAISGAGSLPVEVTANTTIDFPGLANGTSYRFTVAAENEIGVGLPSPNSDPVTPAGPPATPTNVRATARDGFAVVTWNPVADNGAQVTYSVFADPGTAQAQTAGSSTSVENLTNGVTYRFRVRATNAAGSSELSVPSNEATPRHAPPPLGNDCTPSTLPPPPAEVRDGEVSIRRRIDVPCIRRFGRVRMGFFIKDEEVRLVDGGPVVADGNGRDFKSTMKPEDNKVYIELDYSTGTGFVHVMHSCEDASRTSCEQPNSLVNQFNSYVRSDGSIHIDFAVGNSLDNPPGFQTFKISGNFDVLPIPDDQICLFGSVSRFPSLEVYQDMDTSVRTLIRMGQSEFGPYALGAPDRDLPACETTEMPPYGTPPPGTPA